MLACECFVRRLIEDEGEEKCKVRSAEDDEDFEEVDDNEADGAGEDEMDVLGKEQNGEEEAVDAAAGAPEGKPAKSFRYKLSVTMAPKAHVSRGIKRDEETVMSMFREFTSEYRQFIDDCAALGYVTREKWGAEPPIPLVARLLCSPWATL